MFSRERGAGLYETLPYYISKFTVEVPVALTFTMVFSCIFCMYERVTDRR